MKIHLGREIARCPRCGGSGFHVDDEREVLKEWPELICSTCGQHAAYQQLIMQIGSRALAAAFTRMQGAALR